MCVARRRSVFVRVVCGCSTWLIRTRRFCRKGVFVCAPGALPCGLPFTAAGAAHLVDFPAAFRIVAIGHWRTALNFRASLFYRRMRYLRSGMYGVRVRMNFRMWDDLLSPNHAYIHVHSFTGHRTRPAESFSGDRRGSYALISVVNIIYVANIYHVHDIYLRSHVGDVYLAQIAIAMVVPGKKWIARTKRKPYLDICVRAAHESYQCRRIYRPYSDYDSSRDPAPA